MTLQRFEIGVVVLRVLGMLLILVIILTVAGAVASGLALAKLLGDHTREDRSAARLIKVSADVSAHSTQRLLAQRCRDTEIGFASAAYPSLPANPLSPVDGRCQVFHPQGAGLAIPSLPADAFVAPALAASSMTVVGVTLAATAVAPPRHQMLLIMTSLTGGVCAALNHDPGPQSPAAVDLRDIAPFDGRFEATTLASTASNTGCIRTSDGRFMFAQPLLDR